MDPVHVTAVSLSIKHWLTIVEIKIESVKLYLYEADFLAGPGQTVYKAE